jgi:NAD+ diphosphatase
MSPPRLPDRFAFAHAWLDRADALRGDPQALDRAWRQAWVLVVDEQGRGASIAGEPLRLPAGLLGPIVPARAILLGIDDSGQAGFALPSTAWPRPLPEAVEWMDLRQAASAWPANDAAAFAHARGMLHWHSRSRYCGACGDALVLQRAGYVARCGTCQAEHYPRVDPAIIVAVSDGPRLLLGRQASWPAQRWSVLAGFVEPGETLEQAVVREVHEESRVRIRACRYLGSQPWPFPGALMLGFSALAEPDPPQVDGELEAARWVSRQEVGQALAREASGEEGWRLPPSISIARALVEHWYQHGLGDLDG